MHLFNVFCAVFLLLTEGVDFNGGVFNFTFQAGETEKCQSKEAMGLIINDGIYEFIEYFELSAFPADTSTSEKTKVVRSTGRVYIVDDEGKCVTRGS